jgi:hypothetical protein
MNSIDQIALHSFIFLDSKFTNIPLSRNNHLPLQIIDNHIPPQPNPSPPEPNHLTFMAMNHRPPRLNVSRQITHEHDSISSLLLLAARFHRSTLLRGIQYRADNGVDVRGYDVEEEGVFSQDVGSAKIW